MAKSSRRHGTKSSTSSRGSSSTASYKSAGSYETRSTAPTSLSSSNSRPSMKASKSHPPPRQEDISPSTSCYPRSSTDTYNSAAGSDMDLDHDVDMDSYEMDDEIPPLPVYRREVADPHVRPSTPQDFARLFPSMNRLSIRHDDFTPDGNMNLRVDTVVPGRRRATMQLFHLRMHDLNKREFSLRRYCRESGREVCNSKRKYMDPPTDGPATIQRSMSSAFKSLGAKPQFKRTSSGGSLFGSSKPAKRSSTSSSSSASSKGEKRPASSHSSCDGDDEFNDYFARSLALDQQPKKPRPAPSNTIKLEFSNYARVDVSRRGGRSAKRYEFDWWGHKYAWKRVADKNLGVVAFHLLRDGAAGPPVAHIVPETRSPTQVAADESAGGWVPPCHMWISDQAIIEAMTDVADVVVATGLMALVDDCIKERWQTKKAHRIPVPLTSKGVGVEYNGPRSFVQHIFQRRATDQGPSPLRYANHAIPAY